MRHLTAKICLTFALFILSACGDYEKGADAYIEGDHATALSVFQPLAENKGFLSLFYAAEDVINAQSNLGEMYQYGKGIPQDHKTAVKWYRLAAEQGYADAQEYLDKLLLHEKLKSLTLAAENGDKHASFKLGGMYMGTIVGHGIPKDRETARKWYKLAAEQGHTGAQDIMNISVPWWKFWAFYGWWRFW